MAETVDVPSRRYLPDAIRRAYQSLFPWPREYPRPVGWMLSPELIDKLGKVLRKPVDPRRWMRLDDGHAHIEDGGDASGGVQVPGRWCDVRRRLGGHLDPQAEAFVVPPASGELWFDYVADIGDGFAAMYSVGYLLQADLVCADGRDLRTLSAEHVRRAKDAWPVQLAVAAPAPAPAASPDRARLPRGQFMFVGGDTAYHVADRATLAWRLQAPMYWAARDLDDRGLLDPAPRRIYGIPGNHDWYDHLDGFSRVFCPGATPAELPAEPTPAQRARFHAAAPVTLPGYVGVQRGSYLAIQLPWDWQIWGLDIDQPLDERQRHYFEGHGIPAKLVMCVPSPPVVFHRTDPPPNLVDACAALELPAAYAASLDANPLPLTSCRLDLSGDVHHYTRYAGSWPEAGADPSYQTVVSGLGGAFLHPSHTVLGDRPPVADVTFPDVQASRRETSRGATWPALFTGGWMRAVPLLLCLLFGAAWVHPGPAQDLSDWLLECIGLDTPRSDWLWIPDRLAEGAARPAVAEDLRVVVKTVLAFGGIIAIAVALWLAARVRRHRRFDPSLAEPTGGWWAWLSPNRSYRPASAVLVVGGAALIVARWLAPGAISSVILDGVVILLLIGFPVAAGIAIGVSRARGLTRGAIAYAVLASLTHAAVQLLSLLVLVRLAAVAPRTSAAVVVGYLLISAWLPGWLVARGVREPLIALAWIALLTLGLALIVWACAGARVDVHVDGPDLTWRALVERVVLVGGVAVVAMIVGCAHFAWYLAAAARYHNNELGGAARADRYRQFIRFQLTAAGLKGYVIGLEQVIEPFERDAEGRAGAHQPLRPFVLDVFEIKPRA